MKVIKFIPLFLPALLVLTNCTENKPNEKTPHSAETPTADIVKRGAYLVEIMGCNDCHSPKRMGTQGPEVIPETKLSGYQANRQLGKVEKEAIKNGWALFNSDLTVGVGPWGATFAANITSDETGIGNWTEEQFKRALTQGKYKGLETSRMLLPPMPWVNYMHMADDDIHAVFQYLKSTKPVQNVVPAPITPDKL
jgi:mono/diheme cytochrome c family protein